MEFFSNFALSSIVPMAVTLCFSIIKAVLIYIVGKWLIKHVCKLVSKALVKKNIEISLRGFIESIVSVSLWLALIIAIIAVLGVETSSFVALFTGAGMAIGMAMSGTLGNFAGGVMILLFKPYKVGDYIAAQGYEGVVKQIQIFNTILVTLDNQTIIIPNGALSTGTMKNFSTQPYRRVDLSFEFAYGTDYEEVRKDLLAIMNGSDLILKEAVSGEPVDGPWVGLASLGESGVNVATRAWCKSADYWSVAGYMNQTVYQTLKGKGYMFPYNKIDVNIINK